IPALVLDIIQRPAADQEKQRWELAKALPETAPAPEILRALAQAATVETARGVAQPGKVRAQPLDAGQVRDRAQAADKAPVHSRESQFRAGKGTKPATIRLPSLSRPKPRTG